LQGPSGVSKFSEQPSTGWHPASSLSLIDVYRIGRRWAYKKLDVNYGFAIHPKGSTQSFAKLHRRLLSFYESEIN
jgi:hypothetical protein